MFCVVLCVCLWCVVVCVVYVVCVVCGGDAGTTLKNVQHVPKMGFDSQKSFDLGRFSFTKFMACFLTFFGLLPHKHGDWF